MTLHLTPQALDALATAHATFARTLQDATYGRITRTLALLDNFGSAFAELDADQVSTSGGFTIYRVVHEVQPAGPNVVITFALSRDDEDVTVTTITWG